MATDSIANILENSKSNDIFGDDQAEAIVDAAGKGKFSPAAESGVSVAVDGPDGISYSGDAKIVKYTKKNNKEVYIELVDSNIYGFDSGARIIGEFDSHQEFLNREGSTYYPREDDATKPLAGKVSTGRTDLNVIQKRKSLDPEERRAADEALGSAVHVTDDGETTEGSKTERDKVEEDIAKSNQEYIDKFKDKITDFGGQSFLMENIRPFIDFAAGGNYGGTSTLGRYEGGYGHPEVLKQISTDKPEGLIHALVSQKTKDLLAFQQGTPEMFSLLVPQIRLFHERPDGNEIQIPFSMHTEYFSNDPTTALQNREGRGDDVGLVSFDWQFDSGKLALATGGGKSGTATLVLHFQSPEAIVKRRYAATVGGKNLYFRYDQLLSPNLYDEKDNEIKYVNHGVVRALITYGVTPNAEKINTSVSKAAHKKFFKAAKNMYTSLHLTPSTEYEFEFQETGGLNLSIHYSFLVEEFLDDPKINIFGTKATKIKKDLEEAKLKREERRKAGPTAADVAVASFSTVTPEEIEEFRKDEEDAKISGLEKDLVVAKNEVYGPIKESIMKKVNGITFTRGELENYLFIRGWKNKEGDKSGNTYWETKVNVKTTSMRFGEFVDIADPGGSSGNLTLNDEGTVEMHWLYFGDIMASVLDNGIVKDQLEKEGITILLGQAFLVESLRGPNGVGSDPVPIMVNVGDIPINLSLFNKFWTETIVKTKVVNLTFFDFIRKLVNFCLNPILNNSDTLRGINVMRTSEITTLFYTGGKKGTTEEILDKTVGRIIVPDLSKISLGDISSTNPIRKKDKKGYCLITGEFSNVPVSYSGDEADDSLYGVMHYYLARDRGLVKTANFSKQSIPKEREMQLARAFDEQKVGPGTAFWAPFNSSLTLMGNPNIKWGMNYFLNPTMPGMGSIKSRSSAAYSLQLGGYYNCIQVSNSISVNGWETTVEGGLLSALNSIHNPAKAKGPNRKATFIS